MARGNRADDQTTPYLVYSFAWRDKVFYVGIGQVEKTRHTGRWKHVARLLRRERAGELSPKESASLSGKNNSVIAELQRRSQGEYRVDILWTGLGQDAALSEEKKQIEKHLAAGCVLSNGRKDSRPTIAEILTYIGASLSGVSYLEREPLDRADLA